MRRARRRCTGASRGRPGGSSTRSFRRFPVVILLRQEGR
jgi:hypothetical protein